MVGAQGKRSGHKLVGMIVPSGRLFGTNVRYRAALVALIFIISCISVPVPSMADDKTWDGGNDYWSVGPWDPAGVPEAEDSVWITGDEFVVTVNLDWDYDGTYDPDNDRYNRLARLSIGYGGGGRATLVHSGGHILTIGDGGSLVLGEFTGQSGEYRLESGTLSVNNEALVGLGGSGHFNQSGGDFNMNGALYIGGYYGEYIMSNGTLTVTDHITLGTESYDTGYFLLSGGGQVTAGYMQVGCNGYGHFIQNGAGTSNTSDTLFIGRSDGSEGYYTQYSGVHTVNNDLILGDAEGSYGEYNLNGGTLNVSGTTRIGNYGTGIFNQSGGNFIANEVWLGFSEVGYGEYNLSGSGTLETGYLIIGGKDWNSEPGMGVFNQDGGTVTAGGLWIADTQGSTGIYNLYNGDLVVNSWNVIGMRGQGTFNQYGGTHTANGVLEVGGAGTGTYNLVDGTLTANGTIVGNWGEGTFNQGLDPDTFEVTGGGTHTVYGDLILGSNGGTSGTYNLYSGDLIVNGNTFVGFFGTGTFNQSGGNHTANGLVLGQWSGSSGTYNLSGDGSYISIVNDIYLGVEGTGSFIQNDNSIVEANNLFLGTSGGSGSYELNGGSLSLAGVGVIGYSGTGTFTQTGGTHTVNGNLTAGYAYGSTGAYTLSGDSSVTLDVSGTIVLGALGYGEFNQSGGQVTAGGLVLGSSGTTPNPTGIYRLTGNGTLQVNGNETIGEFGHGEFIQDGATINTVNGNLEIATGPFPTPELGPIARSGSYELNSGELYTVNTIVGVQGVGTFTQNGGLHVVSDTLTVGQQYTEPDGGDPVSFGGAAPGTYNMNGGEVVSGETVVGDWGTGTFTQNGGTHRTERMVLGSGSDTNTGVRGAGTYTLRGTGELTITGSTVVGNGGVGFFNQEGGTFTTDNLTLGDWYTGDGTYNMSGGSLETEWLTVGADGVGAFRQTGGSATVNVSMFVRGSYELGSGAVLNVLANEEKMGSIEGAAFTQTGGDHTFAGAIYLGDQARDVNNVYVREVGIYTISGGTLSGGGLTLGEWGGRGEFHHSGGTVTVGSLQLARQNSPIASQGYYELSGTGILNADFEEIGQYGEGHFNQTGGTNQVAGTLTIRTQTEGTGLYELGGGTLNAGSVVNNGTFSFTGGALNVTDSFANNGQFTGAGVMTAAIFTNSGKLAPGNSPGTLTIQGNYTQTSGTLEIELAALDNYDILNITGTADLAGTLLVLLYDGYTPVSGSFFDILTAETITGQFGPAIVPAGWNWTVTYLDTDSLNGIDTVRLTANAVPIPPTVWIFGSALLGLIGIRGRFRKEA